MKKLLPVTTPEKIEAAVRAKLRPAHLRLGDESARHAGHPGMARSGGGHFELLVVADCFRGKTALERHRLVYEALGGMLTREVHALALKTYTPEEWGRRV